MKLTILGCGDAFSSGGRLQTAYLLDGARSRVLVDCGATILLSFQQARIDPESIRRIVITHLHGDHFAGLIWLLMHAMFVARRTAPLEIFGPVGIEARTAAALEVLYPGVQNLPRGFDVHYREMHTGLASDVGGIEVTPFVVAHDSGAPSHALRFEDGGRVFAFSGDSEWTEAIVAAGCRAHLYLLECYKFDGACVQHMAWTTIRQHLDRIAAERVVLTHMLQSMLDRRGDVRDDRITFAEDGAVFDI